MVTEAIAHAFVTSFVAAVSSVIRNTPGAAEKGSCDFGANKELRRHVLLNIDDVLILRQAYAPRAVCRRYDRDCRRTPVSPPHLFNYLC